MKILPILPVMKSLSPPSLRVLWHDCRSRTPSASMPCREKRNPQRISETALSAGLKIFRFIESKILLHPA